jgi:hypothetical protein
VIVAGILLTAADAKPPPRLFLQEPTPAQKDAAVATLAKPGAAGRAAMRCKVQAAGALGDCQVILERPTGAGFGQAILSLAADYRVDLSARQTGRVGRSVITELISTFDADTAPEWVHKADR